MDSIKNTEMKTFSVKRDGLRDLRFKGEKLAFASGRWTNGVERNRWSERRLYKTASGKYVVHSAYRTCWQGESDSDDAVVCDSPQEVYDFLIGENDGRLSLLAKELLEEAAKKERVFSDLLVEEVE